MSCNVGCSQTDAKIQDGVKHAFKSSKCVENFAEGFENLVQRWDKCLNLRDFFMYRSSE